MARARTETHLARRFEADADAPARADGAPGASSAPPPVDRGRAPESVLVEEPLELRVDGVTVATTMRTPGHDYELAAGWCHAEGLLDGASLRGIRYCATGSAVETGFNVVTVDTVGRSAPPEARLTTTTSSCGICGSESVDELTARLARLPEGPALRDDLLGGLSEAVASHQELFALTGGSHAAAAVTPDGEVVVVREDIGRHNAVDKVVGRLLLDGALPATGMVLWVSGRASFEMVQKAWAGGFAALVSVSAPSSLAVRTAERAGLVLVGFARSGRFTVYAGGDRVAGAPVGEVSGVGIATRDVAEHPYIRGGVDG
ncbi:formate dehydrogenase accessory sulfurtransferase FdhD [Dermatobacter hominis]|uniref:formate dehydrogenase accessory sulfurtransferase FdhD n=1 Tax=Dermatobacter hominis TaxID=2884263 RepID=UPI001D0FD8FC|nr:formate dehydrogenase accessory sulfurtransferase FdhD [Dermatobacter hominis]UDY34590.1 formate dehydrogenase accessory sulfurtransferase FdhD [Dermatobacter hominis]